MKNKEFMKGIVFPVILFLILIFFGASVFKIIEGWSYLDALYFSVVTATTLGYGDFVPITVGGKLFTMLYAFCTIGFAFYFFTLVGKYFFTHKIKQELIQAGRIKSEKGVRTIKI